MNIFQYIKQELEIDKIEKIILVGFALTIPLALITNGAAYSVVFNMLLVLFFLIFTLTKRIGQICYNREIVTISKILSLPLFLYKWRNGVVIKTNKPYHEIRELMLKNFSEFIIHKIYLVHDDSNYVILKNKSDAMRAKLML